MNTRWFVLTAAACAVDVPAVIVATTDQDLTDGPAVQDAIVNFGHPVHPQPPAPDHHILDPNDVTIFKGGTVTFTTHGMGHGVAIHPVARTRRAPTLPRISASGSLVRHNRTRSSTMFRMRRRPCRTRLPTEAAAS